MMFLEIVNTVNICIVYEYFGYEKALWKASIMRANSRPIHCVTNLWKRWQNLYELHLKLLTDPLYSPDLAASDLFVHRS